MLYSATDFLSPIFGSRKGQASSVNRFLGGCLAGGLSVTFTYPFEVLKARISSTTLPTAGLVAEVKQVLVQRGLSGFWRGIVPTLVGTSVYFGTKFYVFEVLKNRRLADRPNA